MSWGERSCKNMGVCGFATFSTCNVDCPHYSSNGRKPDSVTNKKRKRKFRLPEDTQSIDLMVNDFFKSRGLK